MPSWVLDAALVVPSGKGSASLWASVGAERQNTDTGPACGAAQIHWFSIINSCVTVLLLTGFLATILMRVLKNDFIKYTRDDEAGARKTLHAAWCVVVHANLGHHFAP